MSGPTNVHATALRLHGRGLLLRGRSGSGKSSLALSVLRRAESAGLDAALVADDQVFLRREGGSLLAVAPPAIAGLIEVRGVGILPQPSLPQTRLDLVVDLVPQAGIERLPVTVEHVDIAGFALRRVRLAERDPAFGADVLVTLVRTPAFWDATPTG